VEKELLAKMSGTLAHRGPDGEGLWIDGPVGLACQLFRVTPESLNETQPLVHSSGPVLVFNGRLDNREDILDLLKTSSGVSADSPDPTLVLAAYEAFGDRFPERLNGDFALGLFDPRRRQLLLAGDPVGIRPLYYYRTGDTFLFASEIKAILAHPEVSTRPNDDMLAAFLVGDRAQKCHGMTFFEGVSSLPPACIAILTPGRFVTRRYWDFDPSRRIRLGSFEEYGEGFRHHFEQAVQRRIRSAYPVAVPLSGGLDSSSIFCLAASLRRRAPERYPFPLGISYTSPDGSPAGETEFLDEIERAYDIPIERFPMHAPTLLNPKEEILHAEGPFLQWDTIHTLNRVAHQRGARVLLSGIWGDQMLVSQTYLVDLFRHLAWGEVRAHLREFGRWFNDVEPRWFRQLFLNDLRRYMVPDVFHPLLRRLRAKLIRDKQDCIYTEAFRRRARQRISNQIFFNKSLATAHARAIYQQARSGHHLVFSEWTSKLASMYGLEVSYPFLDRDLISFLMGIPGEMQTRNGVPRGIQREALRGILPDAIVERRTKADFTGLANEGMELDYPQVAHCLQSGRMSIRLGYVEGDVMVGELMRLKAMIRSPNCVATWRLTDLLGLELWLQAFFGEKLKLKENLEYAYTEA
jgi:asparagine synthase (glutamine-hydrolysing)